MKPHGGVPATHCPLPSSEETVGTSCLGREIMFWGPLGMREGNYSGLNRHFSQKSLSYMQTGRLWWILVMGTRVLGYFPHPYYGLTGVILLTSFPFP